MSLYFVRYIAIVSEARTLDLITFPPIHVRKIIMPHFVASQQICVEDMPKNVSYTCAQDTS